MNDKRRQRKKKDEGEDQMSNARESERWEALGGDALAKTAANLDGRDGLAGSAHSFFVCSSDLKQFSLVFYD
jgi:hypothetical protein